MKIGNENLFSDGSIGKQNSLLSQNMPEHERLNKDIDNWQMKYVGENSSHLNLATRIYADNVIKKALANIESGENIYENKKIIEIFSHIVGENSNKIIYG